MVKAAKKVREGVNQTRQAEGHLDLYEAGAARCGQRGGSGTRSESLAVHREGGRAGAEVKEDVIAPPAASLQSVLHGFLAPVRC